MSSSFTAYSAEMAPSTCEAILGLRYKQEAFPGRIFFKVNSETNIQDFGIVLV